MNLWLAPYLGNHALCGKHGSAYVSVPGSKSLTNRYLVLAALSEPRPDGSPIIINEPLVARDTELMVCALQALGVRIERSADNTQWRVYPPKRFHAGDIACGLAGTVMRFIPPIAALAEGVSIIDGDPEARVRPMNAVVDGLRQLGVGVTAGVTAGNAGCNDGERDHRERNAQNSQTGHHLPIRICGTARVAGGSVTINASASSQFVSGLLLAGARFAAGVDLRHEGKELPSLPHIRMTVELMRAAGVQVRECDAQGCDINESAIATHSTSSPVRWIVQPGSIHQPDVLVEPDLSNAAPFLAAAMLTGGRVRIPNWPTHTTQPGAQLPRIFEVMGGQTRMVSGSQLPGDSPEHSSEGLQTSMLELEGPPKGAVTPIDMDLHNVGELAPTIAAVAAFAHGSSRLRNIGQLRGHETNRLAAMCTELAKIGVESHEEGDDLIITPPAAPRSLPQAPAEPVVIESYADHRMATFGAILGLRIPNLSVKNVETTAKTLPQFVSLWESMIAGSGECA